MRNDITGQRFGRLLAIRPTEQRANHHIIWECKCDCGNIHFVHSGVLKSGLSRSCGCLRRERVTKHNSTGTRLYIIWKNMRKRCSNPNNPKWRRYGGRGIQFDKSWNDFAVFRKWAFMHGYKDNLTIDRINNDLGYYPENCQWLTAIENAMKNPASRVNGKWVRSSYPWELPLSELPSGPIKELERRKRFE